MLYNQEWDKPTTPAQLLRRAADIMETRGMAKGWFIVDPDIKRSYAQDQKIGSMCLQGALQSANGKADDQIFHDCSPLYMETMVLLAANLPRHPDGYENPSSKVSYWNNEVATQEQAVAKLRETADQLELV